MHGKQRKMMGCPLFVRRLQTKPSQERVVAFFGCLFFDKNKFYASNFITLKTKPCTKQHNPDRCSQLAARNRTPFAWIMFSAPACNCSPHAGNWGERCSVGLGLLAAEQLPALRHRSFLLLHTS